MLSFPLSVTLFLSRKAEIPTNQNTQFWWGFFGLVAFNLNIWGLARKGGMVEIFDFFES